MRIDNIEEIYNQIDEYHKKYKQIYMVLEIYLRSKQSTDGPMFADLFEIVKCASECFFELAENARDSRKENKSKKYSKKPDKMVDNEWMSEAMKIVAGNSVYKD